MADGFVKVGKVGDLAPGKMVQVVVGEQRLLLANVDGRYYATADTCTHEDASLSEGSLRGALVKCPLHGSRFDVRTGRAMEEPAEDDLKTYPVRIEGDNILVGMTGPGGK